VGKKKENEQSYSQGKPLSDQRERTKTSQRASKGVGPTTHRGGGGPEKEEKKDNRFQGGGQRKY